MKDNYFDKWWNSVGSGIAPLDNKDIEEHTKKVVDKFNQDFKEDLDYRIVPQILDLNWDSSELYDMMCKVVDIIKTELKQ